MPDDGPWANYQSSGQQSGPWAKYGGASPPPAAPASQPTEFEKERNPDNQEGFLEHAGNVIGSQVKGLASKAVEPYTQAVDMYNASRKAGHGVLASTGMGALGAVGATQGITPQSIREGNDLITGKAYKERRDEGYGPVYSAAAPVVAPAVGIDLPSMEHQSDIGNASGVAAEAAVPAAEAIGAAGAREIPEGAVRSGARKILLDPVTKEPTVTPTSIAKRALRSPQEVRDIQYNQRGEDLMRRGEEQGKLDTANESRLHDVEASRQKELADAERLKNQHAQSLQTRGVQQGMIDSRTARAVAKAANAKAAEEAIHGSAAKPSGRLVMTPNEHLTELQMQKIATQRARENGMKYAAGMRPAGGGRVPATPTHTLDIPYEAPVKSRMVWNEDTEEWEPPQ